MLFYVDSKVSSTWSGYLHEYVNRGQYLRFVDVCAKLFTLRKIQVKWASIFLDTLKRKLLNISILKQNNLRLNSGFLCIYKKFEDAKNAQSACRWIQNTQSAILCVTINRKDNFLSNFSFPNFTSKNLHRNRQLCHSFKRNGSFYSPTCNVLY